MRATWRLPAGPVADVIDLVEAAGAIVVRFPFDTPKVDAISWTLPGAHPLIFVSKDLPPDRERHSICHELGHIVMHRSARLGMEDEANAFAAEFLMPRDDIADDLDGLGSLHRLVGLKPFWRVSMASLLYRARTLNGITDSRYRYLWTQMAPYRQREPAEADFSPDEPGSLQDLFEFHLKDLGYTELQLAELLHADQSDLRAWYGIGASDKPGVRLVT